MKMTSNSNFDNSIRKQGFLIPSGSLASELKISGSDAQSFLQGQFSNDIDKIKFGEFQLNAYCQHQGRIIALILVEKQSQGFNLFLPEELQDIVLNRLKMFALNSAVEISKSEALLPKKSGSKASDLEWYPQVCLATSEKFIPQDLNLDIDEVGVSFSKGCYPGQEVVSRVHYLGKPKRRLYLFECDFDVEPLDKLTLQDSTKVLGVVVSRVKSGVLATLKIVEEGSVIFVNNRPIQLIKRFDFR